MPWRRKWQPTPVFLPGKPMYHRAWQATIHGVAKSRTWLSDFPLPWEICMQVKKRQLEPDMKQWTRSKLGQKYVKAVHHHPAYLTYMQSTSCKMPFWMKHKLKSRLQGEISTSSDIQRILCTSCFNGRKQRGTNSLLMRVKEESEKPGLKLNIQKPKIRASGPITSWQIDGEKVETLTDFIFLGSKITSDCDCSHEIKRHLLFGRKAVTNLDSQLKSRDITLPTKVRIVKAMVFSVVMDRCESWPWRRLRAEELMLSNCGAAEDSWESLGLQGDQTNES